MDAKTDSAVQRCLREAVAFLGAARFPQNGMVIDVDISIGLQKMGNFDISEF